jgi:hypothetical protein
MRIKFEKDGDVCPNEMITTISLTPIMVGSWICQKCEYFKGREGNEVICGREGKEWQNSSHVPNVAANL